MPSRTKNIFSLQHEIWQAATEHAQRRGAFILHMPPDVAWADGSFACLRAALEAGKRALFMTYPRVVSELIGPTMAEHFPLNAHQARTIAAKDMMALAVTHIHPLMAAYDRAAVHFPIHPEMILWPIEGDGFLLRLLARELFCFEPGRYALNSQSLLAQMPPLEEIHVFRNTLEFLGVSFTPLWKDMEWYLARRQLDPLFVGRWWIDYDSPMNDHLSTVNLHFTCGTADQARWRSAESRADALFAHLRSAREFVRILMTLTRMGHSRAAAFLASALRVHGLARRWPHRGPFVVLAPSDEAFERSGFNRVPGDGMSSSEARKIIEAHVAVLPASASVDEGQSIRTLSGRTVLLEEQNPRNDAATTWCCRSAVFASICRKFANSNQSRARRRLAWGWRSIDAAAERLLLFFTLVFGYQRRSPATARRHASEHDPEKWKPWSSRD